MSKQNNLLLIGGAGLLAFVLFKKGFARSGKRGYVDVSDPEIVKAGSEDWTNQPDAVIDADKQGINYADAVNLAKSIIDNAKDAFVVVKSGAKSIGLRKGKKKVPASKIKGRKIKTIRYKGKVLTAKKNRSVFSEKNKFALSQL